MADAVTAAIASQLTFAENYARMAERGIGNSKPLGFVQDNAAKALDAGNMATNAARGSDGYLYGAIDYINTRVVAPLESAVEMLADGIQDKDESALIVTSLQDAARGADYFQGFANES